MNDMAESSLARHSFGSGLPSTLGRLRAPLCEVGRARAHPRASGRETSSRGVVGHFERTGCIGDYTHIWLDVRPHPRFGTIEVRVMDAMSRVDDAAGLAAYVQALVKRYTEPYDAGVAFPAHHRMLTSENRWLAARYGLEAPLIDLASCSRIRVSAARLVRRTLRDIGPDARELGSDRELEGIERILVDGSGAAEQLHVYEEARNPGAVARRIADLTESPALVSP